MATDFSAGALDALAFALAEIAPRRGTLVLFHTQSAPMATLVSAAERLLAGTAAGAHARTELLLEMHRLVEARRSAEPAAAWRDVPVELALGEGLPASAILAAARTERATRIILHTRGRRRGWGMRHRSVAASVVWRASIPVLVLPR